MASNGIHHANLLLGSTAEAESYLSSLCESLGVRLPNNPDFFVFKMETFGIDDARELKSLSVRKAVTTSPRLSQAGQAGKKIFLIAPTRLTLEAQNALLKTFEDPFPDTHFFLVVGEESLIIPTLRSRMRLIRISEDLTSESEEAERFLAFPIRDRLLFAKRFTDEEKNLPAFLDSLLLLLRKREGAGDPVRAIYRVRRLIQDSGAVVSRLVIEHLSLVL